MKKKKAYTKKITKKDMKGYEMLFSKDSTWSATTPVDWQKQINITQ